MDYMRQRRELFTALCEESSNNKILKQDLQLVKKKSFLMYFFLK